MKIWIKFLIGIASGIILSLVIPSQWGGDLFSYLSELFINIGRYAIFPLVFFSMIMAINDLKSDKKILKTFGLIFLYIIGFAVVFIIIGVLSVILFSPERIVINTEQAEQVHMPGVKETLLNAFPKNVFTAFVGSPDILLPIIILAIVIGANLSFDRNITRPVSQLSDSLSRIFYQINSYVNEVYGIALIAITVNLIFSLTNQQMGIFEKDTDFSQFFIVLSIDTAIILFGVFPGLLYLFGERKNPFKWLYAVLGPALIAFITGDEFLSMGTVIKHGNENMGIPRKIGTPVYTMFALFGRAGTAMVTSVSVILFLKSKSNLDITFEAVILIMALSFLISFILYSSPGTGALTAISLLGIFYGRDTNENFLMLKKIAPILMSFGVLLDMATSIFTSFLISLQYGYKPKTDIRDFI
ncbi:MAG: dicarboxylate/amino acid:cation symporter [Spirochaetales bacterium]|nr:dicarboxylate/amino acid:cation symporter [Spirochaetales bacterium]